jgi:hypothetical protein
MLIASTTNNVVQGSEESSKATSKISARRRGRQQRPDALLRLTRQAETLHGFPSATIDLMNALLMPGSYLTGAASVFNQCSSALVDEHICDCPKLRNG